MTISGKVCEDIMAYELIYTSVPQGVKAGSSGFCTVAYTRGLAANVAMLLESLSAYKPCFPLNDVNEAANPVSCFHLLYDNSGKKLHILSRVSFYGTDYTGRTNKLAHHIVCDNMETAAVRPGPAAVFRQDGLFRKQWNDAPQLFQSQQKIAPASGVFRKAAAWERYTGDAGWAGFLAKQFLEVPDKPVFIIFDPLKHTDILVLVEEALQLVPAEKRWAVTFNTYFNTLPPGMKCAWRFCTADAPCLKEARRIPGIKVIDLCAPAELTEADPLIESARSGREIGQKAVPLNMANPFGGKVMASPPVMQPHGARPLSVQSGVPDATAKLAPAIIWGAVAGVAVIVLVILCILFKNSFVPDNAATQKADRTPTAVKAAPAAAVSSSATSEQVVRSKPESVGKKPLPAADTEKSCGSPVDTAVSNDYPVRQLVWYSRDVRDFMNGRKKSCVLENILEPDEKIKRDKSGVRFTDNADHSYEGNGVFVIRKNTPGSIEEETVFQLEFKERGRSVELTLVKGEAKNLKCLVTDRENKIHLKFSKEECCIPGKNSVVKITRSGKIIYSPKTEEAKKTIAKITEKVSFADIRSSTELSTNTAEWKLIADPMAFDALYGKIEAYCQTKLCKLENKNSAVSGKNGYMRWKQYLEASRQLSDAEKKNIAEKWKKLAEKHNFFKEFKSIEDVAARLENIELDKLPASIGIPSKYRGLHKSIKSMTDMQKKFQKAVHEGKCRVEMSIGGQTVWESNNIRITK